ncbi:hypothetical protein HN51_063922 [Arachis hypogaea]
MTDLKLSSLVTGLQKPETCCQRGRIWLNMFSQRRNQPMQSNMKIIYVRFSDLFVYNRWSSCWNFGFTGFKGFVLYFLLMSFTSLVLLAKSKISIHSYFDSRNRVLLDGFLGGLMLSVMKLLD